MMWQIACVRRGSEKRVSNFCKKNGIEHYCPVVVKEKFKKSFLTRYKERGYSFDGFVFVKCDDLKSKLINTLPDVYHYLSWFGKIVTMNQKDLDLIKNICQSDKSYRLEQLYQHQNKSKKFDTVFNGLNRNSANYSHEAETHYIHSLQIKLTEISSEKLKEINNADKQNYEKYYYWL